MAMHLVEETAGVFDTRAQVSAEQVLFEKWMDSTVRLPWIPGAQNPLTAADAVFDPIAKLFLNQQFKFTKKATGGLGPSQWCNALVILNETPAPGWIAQYSIPVMHGAYQVA
jgi:hypothetical protein